MTFQIETLVDSTCSQTADAPKKDYMSILASQESLLDSITPPDNCQIMFEVDGVPFHAFNKKGELIIWGTLGYLPYSLSNYEGRQALIRIIYETSRLSVAKFGIDSEMRLVVIGKFETQNTPSMDYIFEPIIRLIQEARPYIQLIGQYI